MVRAFAAFICLLLFTASACAGHSHHHKHRNQRTFVIRFQLEYIPYTPLPKTKPIAWYALPLTGDEIYEELIRTPAGWNGEWDHYEE